ncbi:sigma factor-like helix-turn-helix DNA-binding protein [Microbacterium sp.]|uniref:sigma factor-like helix-turn-helix DNA-binding protein n=1 Tax=Microbacterium sp. TaxID=51671 RepID=UPI0025E01980|nr:sigma factor-like helix-turn-helix DNA-binding protein [Microbacterium sp.]
MTHDFHTFWLHDEAAGGRFLPVMARGADEARSLVAWTGAEDSLSVIGDGTTVSSLPARRPFLDVSAGWVGLARELHRATEDPALFGLMIGVDVGDVGVASISVGRQARAVWTSRSQQADGADVRGLMESLGWRAVNKDISVSRAVYGELDLESDRVPWTNAVDAAIELAVLLVPDVRAVVRLFVEVDESSVRQIGSDHPLTAATRSGQWPWMSYSAEDRSERNRTLHRAWFGEMQTKMALANGILRSLENTTGMSTKDLMNRHVQLLPVRPPWIQQGDLAQKTAWWHLAAILGRSILSSDEFGPADYDALTWLWRRFVGRVSADDLDILNQREDPSAEENPAALPSAALPANGTAPVATHETEANAREIIERRQSETFGQLFPHIGPDVTLEALRLSARVHNRLVRDGVTTFAGLAPYTVGDVLGWGGVGEGSVLETLRSLLLVSIKPTESSDRDATRVVEAESSSLGLDSWRAESLADIEALARWHRLLGAESASVFVVPDGVAEPPAVVTARERLGQLSAGEVLPAPEGNGSASDLLERLLAEFDQRDLLILQRRVFAEKPETLDVLGAELGITREYVRQREAKAKTRVAAMVAEGELAGLAGVIRAAIVDVLPLRVLLQQFPSLAAAIDSMDAPVWRVLDRLDDSYEIRDDWAARPRVADAVARTKALLVRHATGRAYVEVATIDESSTVLTDEWLDYCGTKRLLGYALVGAAGIADRAAVVLAAEEAPLTAEDIHERLGVPRAVSAVKNALADDERFTRVGRQSWALREWGLKGYQSIKKSIAQIVDASPEGVALSTLVEKITAQVDVSANSIATYAAAHPFITQAGIVRRRTRREMRHPERRKGLAQTRGLFRHGTSVAYRLTITGEHLRGSGTPLPNALGEELDLLQAEKRDVPVRGGGTVTLSWRGPQIAIGSIRTEVLQLGLAAGDIAFLIFHADRTLEVTALAFAFDPLGQVAALTGGPTSGDAIESLADRIDSDASSIAELAQAFSTRGEHQLADLLGRSGELSLTVASLRALDEPTQESDAVDPSDASGGSGSATANSLRAIFTYLLREIDVWTAQTYRAGAEFSPYVQGLREYAGGFACELSSNAYLSPPLYERQLEALRFLGWSDPDPTDGLPNHHQTFSSDVPLERIAEILTKTLLDAIALTPDDDIEFGPHSPKLDAYVARRLARE